MRFAHKIMEEEWADFEKRQRDVIRRRTTRRSGRLEDDRRYSTQRKGDSSVATLKHPVYERFLDMKKNYMGDVKTKYGTRKDYFFRKKGKVIHNRIIFGKLNRISFRMLNELSQTVREYMRMRYAGK